jgi:hypothetical protein
MMKYQLALQFPGRLGTDYDTMVTLEAALTAALGEGAEVDGHDVGSEAMNLFIFTDDPRATFEQVKSLLERHEQLEWVTAAYREVDSDRYTVIWPPDWRKEFKIG